MLFLSGSSFWHCLFMVPAKVEADRVLKLMKWRIEAQGAASAVTGQHSCGSPGGCVSSHGSALLWESWGLCEQSRVSTPGEFWGLYGQSRVSTPVGSWGLYGQSRVSTPVDVLGAVWAVTGQHSCGCPGGCVSSHGSALLWESWGLLGSHGSALMGEFWGCMGSHGSALLWESWGILGKSQVSMGQKYLCHDKTFVLTSILLSQQKMCFVTTNTCLSWQNFCCNKNDTCGSGQR